jgi:hypothetical protein
MALESIIKYWSQSFTFKMFLGMLLYRIADNIIFDIVPTWFPYFDELGQADKMPRLFKEIIWSILMITLLLIVAYVLKVKI